MVNIIHKIAIRAPRPNVYAALSTVQGISSWWTRDTSGESTLGGTVTTLFRKPSGEQIGKMTFKVVELVPGERVRWRFESGPEEWLGTDVTFDISQTAELSVVRFSHANWREAVDFTAHCSMKWATFLLSLKELLETGAGKPAPADLKIDDWN